MLDVEYRDLSNAVELGALGLIVTAARAVIEAAAPLLKGSAPFVRWVVV